ncbi:MAG: cell wall hydrolase [Mesorhizobium amorphae]|nr:MAG: cell wall hydrolase [Mesorhizobium amorphae]
MASVVLPRLLVRGPRRRSLLAPAVLGLGIWVGFPTVAAYQDMASLVSGADASDARWNGFVQRAAAGSVHAAEMPFGDTAVTARAMSGAGVKTGVGTVAFNTKKGARNAVPDETRIARDDKKGRLLKVAPVAPPKNFNAGTVFERTSSLLRPGLDPDLKMTFARSDIQGKEVAIASAFHPDQAAEPVVPAFLASLVTSDKADVLATAYAPAAPDYAKASPFESLLGPDDPYAGRFVPPVTPGDHNWMSTPLPAAVFSDAEQKCLATGIYFEARGESLRGQAAVAQVILNRVRNPSYPKTICGVVYQNDHLKNRCQFSFACDGIPDRIASPAHYKVAEEVALAVTAGKIFIPEVASSTHYYADYVNPGWARTMEKMKKIGRHIFYRTYGGGWS